MREPISFPVLPRRYCRRILKDSDEQLGLLFRAILVLLLDGEITSLQGKLSNQFMAFEDAFLTQIRERERSKAAREEAADAIFALYPASCFRVDGSMCVLKSKRDHQRILATLDIYSEEQVIWAVETYLENTPLEWLKQLKNFLEDTMPVLLGSEKESENVGQVVG